MAHYVVDENVLMVAYGNSTPQADSACRLKAIERLEDIKNNGIIVIDDNDEVLKKYRNKISSNGQPSTARAFIQHVMENYNLDYVIRLGLAKNAKRGYENFPADTALDNFDYDDRIYVALALTNTKKTFISNAVDSDYSIHKNHLENNGVFVEELCPHCLRTT